MDLILSEWQEIRQRTLRQNLTQFILASYYVIGSYMLWKLVGICLNNDSPIVVVLSESMEPGFKRGDIVFLKPHEMNVGDISVFQVYENSIPIIHRVIKKVGENILTKGDNNRANDISLYRKGRFELTPEEIRAGAFGYIPFFGMITIWITSVPGLRLLILAIGFLTTFSDRQDVRL